MGRGTPADSWCLDQDLVSPPGQGYGREGSRSLPKVGTGKARAGMEVSPFGELQKARSSKSGFLNVGPADVLGGIILCDRGHEMHYKMFSSVPGLPDQMEQHCPPPKL
jgi:hypothetical protein